MVPPLHTTLYVMVDINICDSQTTQILFKFHFNDNKYCQIKVFFLLLNGNGFVWDILLVYFARIRSTQWHCPQFKQNGLWTLTLFRKFSLVLQELHKILNTAKTIKNSLLNEELFSWIQIYCRTNCTNKIRLISFLNSTILL